LISISREERINLLSVLPHKLVIPLSTINTTSALLYVGQAKLLVGLAGVHLVKLCIVIMGSLLENNYQYSLTIISHSVFNVK